MKKPTGASGKSKGVEAAQMVYEKILAKAECGEYGLSSSEDERSVDNDGDDYHDDDENEGTADMISNEITLMSTSETSHHSDEHARKKQKKETRTKEKTKNSKPSNQEARGSAAKGLNRLVDVLERQVASPDPLMMMMMQTNQFMMMMMAKSMGLILPAIPGIPGAPATFPVTPATSGMSAFNTPRVPESSSSATDDDENDMFSRFDV
jgi:hypothetical protein